MMRLLGIIGNIPVVREQELIRNDVL